MLVQRTLNFGKFFSVSPFSNRYNKMDPNDQLQQYQQYSNSEQGQVQPLQQPKSMLGPVGVCFSEFAHRDPESLREIFESVSSERNGYISRDGLLIALANAGERVTRGTGYSLFDMFDLDTNGYIDFNEFSQLFGYMQRNKQAFYQHSQGGDILDCNSAIMALSSSLPFLSSIPNLETQLSPLIQQHASKAPNP